MHVPSSHAVSKLSGLCYRHPIPAWLTPALHLIGFLGGFLFGCRSCFPFIRRSLQTTEMPRGWRILPPRHFSSSPC